MALTVTTALRNAWLQAIVDAVTVGTNNPKGKIIIYKGTKAAIDEAAEPLNVLATIPLNQPIGIVDTGELTFATNDALETDNASATGTAAWARIYNRDNETVADCTVTLTGDGGDIQLNSVNIVAGGIVRLNSAKLVAGNG